MNPKAINIAKPKLANIAQFLENNPIKSPIEPNNCSNPTIILNFSKSYRLNSITMKFENKQLIPKKRKESPEKTIITLVIHKYSLKSENNIFTFKIFCLILFQIY